MFRETHQINGAMKKIKNEHTKDVDQLLTTFEGNSNLKKSLIKEIKEQKILKNLEQM